MKPFKKKCAVCKKTKSSYQDGTSKRGPRTMPVFREVITGHRWLSAVCQSCNNRKKRKPINQVKAKNILRARASEKIVVKKLNRMGIKAKQNNLPHGPDVFFKIANEMFYVEVKTATKMKNGNYWKVGYVDKKRMNDDFVATVFPCGCMAFEAMTTHLEKCDKTRSRNVTEIQRKLHETKTNCR